MDKSAVIRNFSRYAYLYDRYADVQQESAVELLSLMNGDGFRKILEIGCGTGNYTFLLREKYRGARIKAIDICASMVEVARGKLKDKNIEFTVQDAEKLVLEDGFDLITSNACFQWFNNYSSTFVKFRRMLNKSGSISFSAFGPLTFNELKSSLQSFLGDTPFTAEGFIDRQALERLLADNFTQIQVKEVRFKKSFNNLEELLRKIKYTGTRGRGLGGKIALRSKDLLELENIYISRFGKIEATYQVFFCKAKA